MQQLSFLKQTSFLKLALSILLGVTLSLGATIFAAPAAAEGVTFPLKPSANGRYLVGQNNQPFFYHADTPWHLFISLSEAEAIQYLDDRQQKGFTVLQIWAAGTNKAGQDAFSPAFDLTRPNEAYWQHVDWVINQATQRGFLLAIAPAWFGYDGVNWRSHVTTENARIYGRFLGNRYKNFNNIIWIQGGDNPPLWKGEDKSAAVRELAAGLQETAPHQLQTYHGGVSSSSWFHNDAWLGINFAYTYGPAVAPEVLIEYNRAAPIRPLILSEARYEEHPNGGTPLTVRRQAYWSLLSGASGHAYGSEKIWFFPSDWKSYLDSPGVRHLSHFKTLFGTRAWPRLIPDQDHKTVTAGRGTAWQYDYVTAARADDGSYAIAYLPTPRTVTVDLNQLSGTVTARWLDPTQGSYSTIPGSPFANTGSRQFTPPTANSTGDSDFVLVLDTNPPAEQSPPQTGESCVVRVMPLGDSITTGWNTLGGYRLELWNKAVAAGLPIDYVGSQQTSASAQLPDNDHEGHNGWRIDQIAANVDAWLPTYRPEVILLMIGANDMIQEYAVETAPDRLSALIDKITTKAPAASLVVSSLIRSQNADPQFVARWEAYSAAIPGIVSEKRAQGKNVTYVEMYPLLTQASDFYDVYHPSSSGHAKIANAWHGAVNTLLSNCTPEATPTFTPEPTPAPAISMFSPGRAPVSTIVTISGANLTGTTSVKFGGYSAGPAVANITTAPDGFEIVSDTQIKAKVPITARSGIIRVTTPHGTAISSTVFRVSPTILGFTPRHGYATTPGIPGTIVTIVGRTFIGTRDVRFGGITAGPKVADIATAGAGFEIVSATRIQVRVPQSAVTGKVRVTTAGGTILSSGIFAVAPRIANFTPTSGAVGTIVTINGANFGGGATPLYSSAVKVKFNGISAGARVPDITSATTGFQIISPTRIKARVPVGAVTGKISVTNGAGDTGFSADP